MRKRKRQTPKKKIDRIVKGLFIYWIVFVSISWLTFWIKGEVPDTLIQYGLGGGAVELLISGGIEISRDIFNKENKGKEQKEDDE